MNYRKENQTQQQVSELSGIRQTNISKIERGLTDPSLKMMAKYLDACGKEMVIIDKRSEVNEL